MSSDAWRKAQVVVSVAWLILLLLGHWQLGTTVVVPGVALLGFWAIRQARPLWRRARRTSEARPSLVVRLSASPRTASRAPVHLETLARLLEDAGLGRVTKEGGRVAVRTAEGDFVQLDAPRINAVTRSDLAVTTSSIDLAVHACEVLAPRLGVMDVEVGGIQLTLDGTRPRVDLDRELHDLKLSRLARLRAELERPAVTTDLPN